VSYTGIQHAAHNAMEDPSEIARFHDRCSDLMRALLEALATAPDEPRPFPVVEDELGWPHRRIASVLGGAARLRQREFEGRRPYRLLDERHAASGRWEIWMDSRQARAIRATRRAEARDEPLVTNLRDRQHLHRT
jgi:hypothetical protein